MASEIRVNQIQNRTGVSTISFTDTGPIFAGVSTVQGSLTVDENLNVGGSIVGNLNVTGVLTYDDVTNVDSVGIITANTGIHIDDSITHLGDTNTKIRFPAADTFTVETDGTERLRVTSDGKIGIGLTNPGALLSIPAGESNTPRFAIESAVDDNDFTITQYEDGNGTYTMLGQNVKLNSGGNNTILDSGHRTAAIQLDARNHGAITFLTGGTNAVTEPVKITSAGDIGINETTPDSKVDIVHSTSTNAATENLIHLRTDPDANYASRGLFVKVGRDGVYDNSAVHYDIVGSSGNSGTHIFEVQGSEKLRINNKGKTGVFVPNGTDAVTISTGGGSGESWEYLRGMHSATAMYDGTLTFRVFTNGDVENTNGDFGNISDIKLKENIVDATSQWDDIKAVKFRKFNFKAETGHQTHTQLGVIAQELELTSPGLVRDVVDKDSDGNDLGTTTKSVKSSILTMKALVALQEAMKRIETLEAQNTDLLSRVAALENP